MNDATTELRAFLDARLRQGFESAHALAAEGVEYAQEKGIADPKALVHACLAELLSEVATEESQWKHPTDCDRLDSAFTALNDLGIVARHNFSCCNNCGFSEIWDEIEKVELSRPAIGYAFYHFQCIDHARANRQLLIAYGSIDEEDGALELVADKILQELQAAGLSASWKRTPYDPIMIEPFVWRRRRPSE